MADLQGIGSILQGVGTFGGAIAVVWAAYKGSDTFEAWRHQKFAERRLEQAERILTASYKARMALGYVRGPMVWAHELSAAEEFLRAQPEWDTSTVSQQSRLKTGQALYNRLNKVQSEREALVDCLPMARAFFGHNLESALETLARQFQAVNIYIDAYVNDDRGQDSDFSDKIRRSIYDFGENDAGKNEVSSAIIQSIKIIESECTPVLRLEKGGFRA